MTLKNIKKNEMFVLSGNDTNINILVTLEIAQNVCVCVCGFFFCNFLNSFSNAL